jgi:hypothetical protein
MADIKPIRKIAKMLENNGLLDETKISYLIELDKKNPAAINKLLKDGKIDQLYMDSDEESEYIPVDHTVDDQEVELDEVLAQIKQTDSYADTIDVIGTKWDDSSRNALGEKPQTIAVINDHIGTGIFNEIDAQVQNIRITTEKLNGISDLDAYVEVAKWMDDNKLFKSQQGAAPNTDKIKSAARLASKQATSDPKLKQQKDAAGGTKSKPTPAKKVIKNALNMSDEEFMKMAPPA